MIVAIIYWYSNHLYLQKNLRYNSSLHKSCYSSKYWIITAITLLISFRFLLNRPGRAESHREHILDKRYKRKNVQFQNIPTFLWMKSVTFGLVERDVDGLPVAGHCPALSWA